MATDFGIAFCPLDQYSSAQFLEGNSLFQLGDPLLDLIPAKKWKLCLPTHTHG
jgi:hypothetical protein